MIPAGVVAAFFLGLILEAVFLLWSDRRAVEREARFWEDLRRQVLEDGGTGVFDWAVLEDPKA